MLNNSLLYNLRIAPAERICYTHFDSGMRIAYPLMKRIRLLRQQLFNTFYFYTQSNHLPNLPGQRDKEGDAHNRYNCHNNVSAISDNNHKHNKQLRNLSRISAKCFPDYSV